MNIYAGPKAIFLLFIIALLIRTIFLFTYSAKNVYTDAVMYHNYAVNIAAGNGFTDAIEAPYDLNFFREPGNVYFIATAYNIASLCGVEIKHIDPENDKTGHDRIRNYHPEIYWARILFALLEAISVVFFYKTLKRITSDANAFIIALIYAFFYPAFFFVATLMRESLLTGTLIILNYYFVSYIFDRKTYQLIIVGILLGICILVFQAMVVLSILLVTYLFIYKIQFSGFIKESLLLAFICIITISPWMIKIYNYHSDIRVLKTFGVSLTTEMSGCMTEARMLECCKGMSKSELNDYLSYLYELPSNKQFQYSFDGTFKAQRDSLRSTLSKNPNYTFANRMKFKLLQYKTAVSYFICPNYFSGIISSKLINDAAGVLKIIYIVPYIMLFLMCILGVFGVFANFKQLLPYISIYWVFLILLLLMPWFGSEGRRFLPMFTLWLPAFVLQVQSIINKLKSTNKTK